MRLPQQNTYFSALRLCACSLLLACAVPFTSIIAAASTAQLTSSPVNLKFGVVEFGQTETQLVTLSNTGTTGITISSITSDNSSYGFSKVSTPMILGAGQSFNLDVTFSPSSTGWVGGSIQFVSTASNPNFALRLAGTGESTVALTANPSTLSFGQVSVGSKATLPVVITNDRTWKVTVTSAEAATSQFSVSGMSFPLTLNPGQSISASVTFAPTISGEAGSYMSTSTGLTVPLTGTGSSATSGLLSVSPAPLNFGNVNVGSSATQSLTLSASGASVTVSSASSANSQFVLESASFPFTIAAGQSQSFNVAFTPKSSGAESSTLTFASNASDPQDSETVSGTGTVATYSVSLSWNSSLDVTGYNVYRSATSNGTYSKVNSSLDPSTAYTDSSVASGKTYYYAATSVSSSGTESAKSTPPVMAVIP